MTKTDLPGVVKSLYDLLEPLDADIRTKALDAVLVMIGQPSGEQSGGSAQIESRAAVKGKTGEHAPTDAASYFALKQPENKIETLAVAARYRETTEGAGVHTKQDLQKVVATARRDFDASNYSRDIANARTKGLFIKGKKSAAGQDSLSYKGQQYVDALPDREAAKRALGSTKRKKAATPRRRPNLKKP